METTDATPPFRFTTTRVIRDAMLEQLDRLKDDLDRDAFLVEVQDVCDDLWDRRNRDGQ